MKPNKFLLLALIAILLSFSLTLLFYMFYVIEDIQQLDMKINIEKGSIIGFDTNKSVISFGTLSPGGSSQRPVILKNIRAIPVRVYTKKSGKMAEWVYISENNFILGPNEEKTLNFTAILPQNAEPGSYKGKVKFFFIRAG